MAEAPSPTNTYLGEVMQHQAKVDQELRRKRWAGPVPAAPAAAPPARSSATLAQPGSVDWDRAPGMEAVGGGISYRITGVWRWRTVVVPPNVYVVHTRRGHPEPVTVGLGVSFRYDPSTDAFLLIPAAMQTIIINAKCICKDRQGVLVQAYVQWIIDDIRTAYRKLDFSDADDPMRIVNVQLREQAEAAIKDKVSTMSIDEVLTDKQSIIDELTHRLRQTAEGSREGPASTGLGLKIVTVQIKEAVVSSTRLWENLQKPFRAEREKEARLAELAAQQEVAARELQSKQARQVAELDTEAELARRRAAADQQRYDREQAERARRLQLDQEAERRELALRNETEMARRLAEVELALKEFELAGRRVEQEVEAVRRQMQVAAARADQLRAAAAAEVEVEELRSQAQAARAERELAQFKARRAAENDLSDGYLRKRLIDRLPAVAEKLPRPAELREVHIGGDGSGGTSAQLTGFLAGVLNLVESALGRRERNGAANGG